MRDGQPRIEFWENVLIKSVKNRETMERIKRSEKNRVIECFENLGRESILRMGYVQKSDVTEES